MVKFDIKEACKELHKALLANLTRSVASYLKLKALTANLRTGSPLRTGSLGIAADHDVQLDNL
jgi:hypothetical protein